MPLQLGQAEISQSPPPPTTQPPLGAQPARPRNTRVSGLRLLPGSPGSPEQRSLFSGSHFRGLGELDQLGPRPSPWASGATLSVQDGESRPGSAELRLPSAPTGPTFTAQNPLPWKGCSPHVCSRSRVLSARWTGPYPWGAPGTGAACSQAGKAAGNASPRPALLVPAVCRLQAEPNQPVGGRKPWLRVC